MFNVYFVNVFECKYNQFYDMRLSIAFITFLAKNAFFDLNVNAFRFEYNR